MIPSPFMETISVLLRDPPAPARARSLVTLVGSRFPRERLSAAGGRTFRRDSRRSGGAECGARSVRIVSGIWRSSVTTSNAPSARCSLIPWLRSTSLCPHKAATQWVQTRSDTRLWRTQGLSGRSKRRVEFYRSEHRAPGYARDGRGRHWSRRMHFSPRRFRHRYLDSVSCCIPIVAEL